MSNQERRIIVRPIPRMDIDLQRLARCIIELAIEQQRRAKEATDVGHGERSEQDAA